MADRRCANWGASLASLVLFLTPAHALGAQQPADEPEGVVDAVKQGTVRLAFRYRYEFVDQEDIAADAHASTLRTVLGFRTAPLRGFDFLIEAENVVVLGDDWYRDAGRSPRGNSVAGRPVVADPAGTDINQVMVRYRGYDSDVRIGRQEIDIADQRFVGTVAWRQHHQTFAGASFSNSSIDGLSLRYVFNTQVYRVFGDKVGTTNHFLHVRVDAGGVGTLRAYGILLDYDDLAFAGRSTNSFGAELAGSFPLTDRMTAHYEAEYARQVDAAANPSQVRADYVHLMAGVGFSSWVTARVGWELLGGSERDGSFQTPLATLHKFNGWADKFLTTPTNGLEDSYVQLDGNVGPFAWTGVLHGFRADSGGASYGDEVDWQVSYRSPWQQTFAFKGAYYAADTFSVDTLKLWLFTAYAF